MLTNYLSRWNVKFLTSVNKRIPKLLFYSNSHASIFHDILRVTNVYPSYLKHLGW